MPKTYFNKDWMQEFAWLALPPVRKGDGAQTEKRIEDGYCTLCCHKFRLSNMGKRAVTSHMESAKHKGKMALQRRCQEKISNFCKKPSDAGSSGTLATDSSQAGPSSVDISAAPAPAPSATPVVDLTGSAAAGARLGTLAHFISDDEVTRAEIYWILHTLECHYSYNSNRKFTKILLQMMPTFAHEFVNKLKLSPTKVVYVTTYGLAPYFSSKLLQKIRSSGLFVTCFDEAFNRISQRCQMDLHIRFWNENKVESRYFNSMFLGHSRASEILTNFIEGLKGLEIKQLIQISMDGPNVNWKFIELFKKEFQADADSNHLLEIGSCGLHNVAGILRALYYLFVDSPARKQDFTEITGSSIFPLKFCGHRWVENVKVAERALETLSDVRKYVTEVKQKPTSQSFRVVSEALKDKFLEAKIAFFKSVALELEPFLTKYQTAKPLAPFLFDDLFLLLQNLAKRYLKGPIKSPVALLNAIDDADSRKPAKEIDIGRSAQRRLPSGKNPSTQELKFYMDARTILEKLCSKLKERSPLKYGLVKNLSCLVPARLAGDNQDIPSRRFGHCVDALLAANRISDTESERAVRQFGTIGSNQMILTRLKKFNSSEDRLDELYCSLFASNPEFKDVWKCIEILLLLSHGQATVESGFSINEDIIVPNLKERSLVAQRTVYDAIKASGGADLCTVDRELLLKTRSSYSAYRDHLEQEKKTEKEEKNLQKRAAQEIINSPAKQRKIEEDRKRLDEELEEEKKKVKNLKDKLKK